ncbi:MAG: phospholipase D-like domain-containing protein [Methylicorpusculum sp.]|nr:phospholipase D-like domain-containing protein [Methylicorpusculum sp.]
MIQPASLSGYPQLRFQAISDASIRIPTARGQTLRDFTAMSITMVSIIATFLITALGVLLVANLSLGNKPIDRHIETLYSVADSQFLRSIGSLLGPSIIEGNRVQALVNGNEIFPAMLKAIRGAQKTITFETFIYWSGTIGQEFAEALSERARAGVRVHVMLDWLGSGDIDETYVTQMEEAGIEVLRYNPLRWYTLARMNHRTHRKLLVVDGKIGFTGGVGIAIPWTGNAQDPQHWRDTHFRIEGPVVAQMQAAFLDNWIEVSGHVLHGAAYFPPIEPAGTLIAQVFMSSPGGGAESAQLMYLLSIAAAKTSVQLSMSYFVPDNVAVNTFIAARKRGVRIQMLVPGPYIDRKLLRRASRFEWGPLLRAGIEIYEYQPTMFHCKVMVVDELWTSVGSTNFDSRSFSVNDEANLNIYDADFARIQMRIFEHDLHNSRRITLEEWEDRLWSDKVMDGLAGLFSSQL